MTDNTITERFQIPKQTFSNPDDLTTWATILRTRYWNDCMRSFLENMELPTSSSQISFTNLSEAQCKEMESYYNLNSEVAEFIKIKFFRQKPCLFGNSAPRPNVKVIGETVKPRTCGIKRQESTVSSCSMSKRIA